MTDCSQVQAVVDEAQQELQLLQKDPLAYCQDQCDPGDEDCIRQCMRSTGSRKQALEQETADLEYDISMCHLLGGTWIITLQASQVQGQLTITSWDHVSSRTPLDTFQGTMISPDTSEPTNITGYRDDPASVIRFNRYLPDNRVQEYTAYTTNFSAQPPTMSGEFFLSDDRTQSLYPWSAQKQS
jgi:hypothetical protein